MDNIKLLRFIKFTKYFDKCIKILNTHCHLDAFRKLASSYSHFTFIAMTSYMTFLQWQAIRPFCCDKLYDLFAVTSYKTFLLWQTIWPFCSDKLYDLFAVTSYKTFCHEMSYMSQFSNGQMQGCVALML